MSCKVHVLVEITDMAGAQIVYAQSDRTVPVAYLPNVPMEPEHAAYALATDVEVAASAIRSDMARIGEDIASQSQDFVAQLRQKAGGGFGE